MKKSRSGPAFPNAVPPPSFAAPAWRVQNWAWIALPALCLAAPAKSQRAMADASGAAAAGVSGRTQPGYEVAGFKLGGFTALPTITTELLANDNVFARRNAIADQTLTLRPRLLIRSDWSRHSLTFVSEGEIQRFADLTSQNSEQVDATLSGRVDITNDVRLTTTATAARLIERRGSAGDVFGTGSPIEYRQFSTVSRLTGNFNRITAQIGAGASTSHYYPVDLEGSRVSLSFRDYRRVDGMARVGYAIGPSSGIFVNGTVNSSTYANDPGAPSRNSKGYSVLGGIAFDVSDLINAEVGVGRLSQKFSNPAFPDVSGLDFSASLDWNPTPLLSIGGNARRTVVRSPLRNVGGIRQSTASLNADYELLRQLVVSATTELVLDRYEGIDRRDRRISATASARYLVSRNIALGIGASHRRQRSKGQVGREYDENIVRVSLTLRR